MPRRKPGKLADMISGAPFMRNVLYLMGGSAASQIILLATMPIVTRLYGVEALGQVAIFIAFVSIFAGTICFKLDEAIIIARHPGDIEGLVLACLFASVVGSPFLLVFYELFQNVGGFGEAILPGWARYALLPAGWAMGVFLILRALTLRSQSVVALGAATFIRQLANAIVRLVGGGFGLSALIVSELVFLGVGPLVLGAKGGALVTAVRRLQIGSAIHAARLYRKFVFLLMPSALINAIALNLPIPLIAARFGLAEAAWFALAHRLASAPVAQIGMSVADVFQMRASEYIRKGDKRALLELTLKVGTRAALVGGLVMLGIAIVSPFVFEFVFGEGWGRSGQMVTIIAPWLAMAIVALPLSRLLSVLERQELKFIYDLVSVLAIVGVFSASYVFSMSIWLTLITLSIAMVLAYGIYIGLALYAVRTSDFHLAKS